MNYTTAVKQSLPQRLESTAPANPIAGINRAGTGGAQTATASSNRQYQSSQNPMLFTDRGVYKKSSTNGGGGPTDENPPSNFQSRQGVMSLSPSKDQNLENVVLPGKKQMKD
jgi:hypothetical protein